ncbi:hypothetical protein Csa_021419 [Cucumis sativus]|uniref:Uncharacterized protein n=1 Tax=Cucumis sativus TaxID=3659 RepID=A0A0A0KSB6_CUCSA|nr:hypothetical protein Csa_021419 [Cucumis sativus]
MFLGLSTPEDLVVTYPSSKQLAVELTCGTVRSWLIDGQLGSSSSFTDIPVSTTGLMLLASMVYLRYFKSFLCLSTTVSMPPS